MCSELCGIEWYIEKNKSSGKVNGYAQNGVNLNTFGSHNNHNLLFLVCARCYDDNNFPKEMSKGEFEFSNFFSIIGQITNEGKPLIIVDPKITSDIKSKITEWSTEETIKLIEVIESQGENCNWDEVVKVKFEL